MRPSHAAAEAMHGVERFNGARREAGKPLAEVLGEGPHAGVQIHLSKGVAVSAQRRNLPAVVETAAPVTTSTLNISLSVPAMIAEAGDGASRRFLDFFAASIDNDNRRMSITGSFARSLLRSRMRKPCEAHESPRTSKLYDRTGDEITLDEVERISI